MTMYTALHRYNKETINEYALYRNNKETTKALALYRYNNKTFNVHALHRYNNKIINDMLYTDTIKKLPKHTQNTVLYRNVWKLNTYIVLYIFTHTKAYTHKVP